MSEVQVNRKLVQQLIHEDGLTRAAATRALYFSGDTTRSAALRWYEVHQSDPEVDQTLLVSPAPKEYVCLCGRSFNTHSKVDTHVKAAHKKGPKQYCVCPRCGTVVEAASFSSHHC